MAVIIQSGNTTANVVTTITFDTYYPKIEIINRGDTDLWIRADGTNPTVAGDECDIIPAHSYKDNIVNKNDANTIIKIISSAAIGYTVEGVII